MSSNIVFHYPNNCTDFKNEMRVLCLPKKIKCDNTVRDGIYLKNDQDPCEDNPRNWKIPVGGNFQVQYNFFDFNTETIKTAVAAWGSWLTLEINGTANAGVRKGNGYDGTKFYQHIEINPSTIADKCFQLEANGNSSIVKSREFEKEDCLSLIELEAVNSGGDCWNGYYGSSEFMAGNKFEFNPKAWIRGRLKTISFNVNTKVETLRIVPSELMPRWYVSYLVNRIFSGNQVKIDGVIYTVPNVVVNSTSKSTMFPFQVDLERICNVDGSGNTSISCN